MRSVLILGSGRSGTSMLAGAFAHAGWHVGADPYPARSSNPKGFFESKEINGVNEYLLALGEGDRLGPWQRWLAELPRDWSCPTDARVEQRIAALARRAPYCFKDPRFAYTLPAWSPFTQDALRVCVFRHPLAVARSIVKECAQEGYLRGVDMSVEKALAAWLAAHRRILDRLRADGEWCFVHYDQVLSGEGLERLETLVGAPLAREFPDASLQRNVADEELEGELASTYAQLCELSRKPGALVGVGPAPTLATSATPLRHAPQFAEAEAYAQELARWLEHGVEGSGGLWRELRGLDAASCEQRILDLLPQVGVWRRSSNAAARSGLARLAALEALAGVHRANGTRTWSELEALAPWPIATRAPLRIACWPRWTKAALGELLAKWAEQVPASLSCALVLRHDAASDGALQDSLAELQRAYDACFDPSRELEVHVLGPEFDQARAKRLARSVLGVLTLEDDARSQAWASETGARRFEDCAELARVLAVAARQPRVAVDQAATARAAAS